MIAIRHLDKTYNRGKANAIHVVNDVTLDLPDAGMVAIFGRSGCGKTTLLNVVGGLDRVESGSVEIDGEKMTSSSDALRNRSIGYIFQNYCLHRDKTCRENVADALRLLGVSDRTFIDAQVDAALRAVGMERFASRLPDTLSGGQQQRIAIARAIVKNPPVILADEPTGNLDEANTLHVMRLLKAISRDRLVLLVTHEENLVSAFSDRVIELSDGKVVSDRSNLPTKELSTRDKNAVYLGELPRQTLRDEKGVTIDLYGDVPDVKLRLVGTKDGQVYLKIDSGKVTVLDASSEVRLENGTPPKADEQGGEDALPDLSAIKPVKGARPGRLFGFFDAWKSGIRSNLGKQRRGRKVLRTALILFAAVVVFMTASLGVFVRKLLDVDGTYHHRLIYAYAGDETSAGALAAIGAETGVNYRQITFGSPSGERNFSFNVGNFETFSGGGSYYRRGSSTVESTGIAMLRSAAEGRSLLAGKNEGLAESDALISEGAAKALLKSATVNYLKSYDDLIGVYSDGGDFRIAGIVSGGDREIFLSTSRLLETVSLDVYVSSMLGGIGAPDDGFASVILPYSPSDPSRVPAVGDEVLVNGKTFTVDRVIQKNESYADWCAARGYGLTALSDAITFDEAETYLAHYPEYLNERIAVFGISEDDSAVVLWQTGIRPDALYWANATDGTARPALVLLAYRSLWREAHPGEATPDADAVREWAKERGDEWLTDLYKERANELYYLCRDLGFGYSYSKRYVGAGYLLNEKEAEAALSRVGKTTLLYPRYDGYGDIEIGFGEDYFDPSAYLAIRTSDPEKTVAAIKAALGEHYAELRAEGDLLNEWNEPLYSPDDFRREALDEQRGDIVSNAIELGVFLFVMSLCMYLMMRASMMGRIREIGIYRAIGVSKKNLIFRFFVESLAVASLTVLVGYLFSSLLISAWLVKTPLIGNYFYYPLPMALGALALLYAVSALCGTLPVLRLLRKTPSEILSKYDI